MPADPGHVSGLDAPHPSDPGFAVCPSTAAGDKSADGVAGTTAISLHILYYIIYTICSHINIPMRFTDFLVV